MLSKYSVGCDITIFGPSITSVKSSLVMAITNEDLTEVIEGPNIVISQPTEYLDNMDDWNQDHHSRSGLLDEVKKSEISQEDAELRTLNFIKEHVGKNKSPLCGNTIHHDRKFLTLYMPQLEEYFHYRNIDVSLHLYFCSESTPLTEACTRLKIFCRGELCFHKEVIYFYRHVL